jgi:hypothetical protein
MTTMTETEVRRWLALRAICRNGGSMAALGREILPHRLPQMVGQGLARTSTAGAESLNLLVI